MNFLKDFKSLMNVTNLKKPDTHSQQLLLRCAPFHFPFEQAQKASWHMFFSKNSINVDSRPSYDP